ncbi:MAG: hypothetical protein KDD41_10900 [Flavobacteriales bacterium]|nr:hypothetical protein [Flavobacteriales bacterium]
MVYFFIALLVILKVGLSYLIGLSGKKREIGFWASFLISLFFGFVLGLIVTFISKDLNQTRTIVRCDGCKKEINGEYIAIRPTGMNVKLDYCNETCRDTYHAGNMERLKSEG